MMDRPQYYYGVGNGWQPILADIGLGNSDAVFTHPDIRVWRKLPDRENGIFDAMLHDGRAIRLHVKRYASVRARRTPGEAETEGVFLLERAQIPTLSLAAWGRLPDRRSFVITEDLAGFDAADKRIERCEITFDDIRDQTSDLVSRLHNANLHHRDLYLCHFFARSENGVVDLRLIDAARVKMLPRWFFRARWIVKDLAQFWYSATRLNVDEKRLDAWLARYARQRNIADVTPLRAAIVRKVRWIENHDARLNRKQPDRNVSIPR